MATDAETGQAKYFDKGDVRQDEQIASGIRRKYPNAAEKICLMRKIKRMLTFICQMNII